jgi:hypothetical protein
VKVGDGLGDERTDSFGELTIPFHLRFDVDLELVESVGVISHKSPEPLHESDFEIAETQVTDSNPRSVHLGRVAWADALLGGAERQT